MDFTGQLVAVVDWTTLPQQVVNGILIGAIYALIALGYTMVYGVLRLINFAHGEVFMLGAYTSLLTSWALGFGPGGKAAESSWFILVILLVVSMTVCGLIGVLIERFAYRPMRTQPRIAALITAIGISMLLQYGGALFLPNSPPPSISEKVNPFRGSSDFTLVAPEGPLREHAAKAQAKFDEAKKAFEPYLANPYDIPKEAAPIRETYRTAERELNDAKSKLDNSGVRIRITTKHLIMLIATVVLMLALTYLVMFTKPGRAMRAVSHDFDAASLMGVDVNRTITFTFLLGSMLAGAGAMMYATFSGVPLTTFFGLLPGVKAFVAAVLGGIGNIPGAVLGAVVMGVAEGLMYWLGSQSFHIPLYFTTLHFDGPGWGIGRYADAVAFVILIVVLLFRPGGILGSAKVEKV
jgi:branched-chain amino acid transport system permease protein